MKSKNTIPKGLDQVVSLGSKVLTAAVEEGDEIALVINTAPKIRADFFDLNGDPATPLVPGKQAAYAAQKAVVAEAYAAGRSTVDAGRKFCQFAVDVLKRVLGAKWNSQWNAVGFIAPTLEVPRNPLAILSSLRAYYRAHPEHEVALLDLTAADAEAHFTAIQQATLAISQARALLVSRKKARDAALAQLRKRLSGLRSELDQLLTKTDGRWYDFGFYRPVDRVKPAAAKAPATAPAAPAAAAHALAECAADAPVCSEATSAGVAPFSTPCEAQASPALPCSAPSCGEEPSVPPASSASTS